MEQLLKVLWGYIETYNNIYGVFDKFSKRLDHALTLTNKPVLLLNRLEEDVKATKKPYSEVMILILEIIETKKANYYY